MAAKENNRFVKIYAQGALVQTEIWVELSPGCSISFTGTEMPLGSPRCWGRTGSL